jgi:hypothetical protein
MVWGHAKEEVGLSMATGGDEKVATGDKSPVSVYGVDAAEVAKDQVSPVQKDLLLAVGPENRGIPGLRIFYAGQAPNNTLCLPNWLYRQAKQFAAGDKPCPLFSIFATTEMLIEPGGWVSCKGMLGVDDTGLVMDKYTQFFLGGLGLWTFIKTDIKGDFLGVEIIFDPEKTPQVVGDKVKYADGITVNMKAALAVIQAHKKEGTTATTEEITAVVDQQPPPPPLVTNPPQPHGIVDVVFSPDPEPRPRDLKSDVAEALSSLVLSVHEDNKANQTGDLAE